MRVSVLPVIAAVVSLILAGAVPAAAQTSEQLENVVFTEIEKRILGKWLGNNRTSLPRQQTSSVDDDDDEPARGGKKGNKGKGKGKAKGKSGKMPKGLAKRKELPPGLAKKSELPPGLAKRNLPADLERRLPPPQPGTSRVIVEDVGILLVETGTNIVLDVIEDVLRGK